MWWDTAYADRIEIDVTTGANVPDKGYVGYTARVAVLDTQALIAAGDMQADCSDLRMTYYNGIAWQELPRHVINCDGPTTDVRFSMVVDIPASSNDDNYYLYYNNSTPAALPAMTITNVYLWYDNASIDRSGSYIRGRIDAWHGNGWDNSLAWDAAGYYTYDDGDNFTSGYRRDVDIIQSGTLGSDANHIRSSIQGACSIARACLIRRARARAFEYCDQRLDRTHPF